MNTGRFLTGLTAIVGFSFLIHYELNRDFIEQQKKIQNQQCGLELKIIPDAGDNTRDTEATKEKLPNNIICGNGSYSVDSNEDLICLSQYKPYRDVIYYIQDRIDENGNKITILAVRGDWIVNQKPLEISVGYMELSDGTPIVGCMASNILHPKVEGVVFGDELNLYAFDSKCDGYIDSIRNGFDPPDIFERKKNHNPSVERLFLYLDRQTKIYMKELHVKEIAAKEGMKLK